MDTNPQFERWVVTQTFSGLDTPLPWNVKMLMQRSFEGGQQHQADQDAKIIEPMNELLDEADSSALTKPNSLRSSDTK